MRVANRDMGACVDRREPFKNSNDTVFGCWSGEVYTVFSYGNHFPMYSYDCQCLRWFGNSDKYSVTTSRHQSQCRPEGEITWLRTEQMTVVSRRGYAALVADRIGVECVS